MLNFCLIHYHTSPAPFIIVLKYRVPLPHTEVHLVGKMINHRSEMLGLVVFLYFKSMPLATFYRAQDNERLYMERRHKTSVLIKLLVALSSLFFLCVPNRKRLVDDFKMIVSVYIIR